MSTLSTNRYDMGDRNVIADMIEEAVTLAGAKIEWLDYTKNPRWRYYAHVSIDDYSVKVEAGTPKWGARVYNDNDDRTYDFHNAHKLAASIKSRVARMKKTDAENDAKWERSRQRDVVFARERKAAKERLIAVFNEETVDNCFDIDVFFDAKDQPTVMIKVYATKQIKGIDMSVDEAVRFASLLQGAGYKLGYEP